MTPDFMLLYVNDPAASARFYGDILGRQPVNASDGFVMFEARPGLMLGLWRKETVTPAANLPPHWSTAARRRMWRMLVDRGEIEGQD